MSADSHRSLVDDFLVEHFSRRNKLKWAQELFASVQYSVFSGGKRFRPQVCYLAAETLGCAADRVTPFAAAVELIHTYSLIHDDLPCMDDDDFRRDQPTNHRVYGEATALLAGDALLTEAFYILATAYEATPEVGLTLTKLLSDAAGMNGMVAGQVIDMAFVSGAIEDKAVLLPMHELKTGALIRVAARGVAEVARANAAQKSALEKFGSALGLAFQLADDILDYDPQNLEASGLPKFLGVDETKRLLSKTTQEALNQLEIFGASALGLRHLIEYNAARKK